MIHFVLSVGLDVEIPSYIMWRCPSSNDLWADYFWKIQKCSSEDDDFLLIFNRVLEKLEAKDVELVATIAIRIWIWRNTLLFGGSLTHHSYLVWSAKESVEDFWRDAQNMRNNFEQEHAMVIPKWIDRLLGYCRWTGCINRYINKKDRISHNC